MAEPRPGLFAAARRGLGVLLGASLLAEARCSGCGRVLSELDGGLCPDCLLRLRAPAEAAGPCCPSCGEPAEAASPCPRCREKPRPWSLFLACGPYDGQLRDMILAYKFQGRLELGRRLQECALAAFEAGLARHPELSGCQCLVPVPLHPRRLASRGFNQSREIARLLSGRRDLPLLAHALKRVRRTTPQMELAREARAENIRGAFAARAGLVERAHVLLVDDIATTGATLEECARALFLAGASRVDVLVLARA